MGHGESGQDLFSNFEKNREAVGGGTRITSMALYFYAASKKSLQKPRANFGNIFFPINYCLNYYLQLLFLQFLYRSHLNF